jgi:hypothetical protein
MLAGQHQPNQMRFMTYPTFVAPFAEEREPDHLHQYFPSLFKETKA